LFFFKIVKKARKVCKRFLPKSENMDVIAYCKENYEYEQLQNCVRVNGVVDIYRRKKGGKISVFILPEETWYYPKNEEEFSDIVVNFLEHYTENPAPKKIKKRKEFTINPQVMKGYRKNASSMKDTDLMPFGKHSGEKMGNVPPDYLIWLFENNKCYGPVLDYIKTNEENLRAEIKMAKKGIR
jgi:Putative quorum-sensing-regulated virulence factor